MTNKVQMTDEERLQLAGKLDNELDEWMDGLEKKSYNEGWPEDKWEQEMEKHPFFMTKFPENPADTSPLLQGIQQLKYDDTANTPAELAQSYKEDGNFNFKHKKYRMAVISYTEGIRKKCNDDSLNASLYNNRSAAQYFLSNYRSSLMDCQKCLGLDPNHDKALLRSIQCCIHLRKPKDVMTYCDKYLQLHPGNKEVTQFRDTAYLEEISYWGNLKKEKYEARKEKEEILHLLKAMKDRNVEFEVEGEAEEVLMGMHERPTLNDGKMTWPVFFLYPEYSQSDFIEKFDEDNTITEMFGEIFSESPDWDKEKVYNKDNLNVYYEAADRSHIYTVNTNLPLHSVLQGKGFVARDWRPAFLTFVKKSKAEQNFLRNYTVF